jgi:hypothetical protein
MSGPSSALPCIPKIATGLHPLPVSPFSASKRGKNSFLVQVLSVKESVGKPFHHYRGIQNNQRESRHFLISFAPFQPFDFSLNLSCIEMAFSILLLSRNHAPVITSNLFSITVRLSVLPTPIGFTSAVLYITLLLVKISRALGFALKIPLLVE